MRISIDLETFTVAAAAAREIALPGRKVLYVSPGSGNLRSIDELAQSEYAQAVEIDPAHRAVRFGRDYLGHFPLLYGCTPRGLHIGDDFSWVLANVKADAGAPRLCEEALALYLGLGYVPAGLSLYQGIAACEPHAVYRWRRGRVEKDSTFVPVDMDPQGSLLQLERAIDAEVQRSAALSQQIDIWCWGGSDCSIMACLFNTAGRRADVLALRYGPEIHEALGDGERSHAYLAATRCGARLREIDLSPAAFERAHERLVSLHPAPVMDAAAPARFALGEASRGVVITGEGGERLLGARAHPAMALAESRGSVADLGWHYAMSQGVLFPVLGRLLRRARALSDYVVDYANGMLRRYPGDLARRLMYAETHVRAASVAFPHSYHACRVGNALARHPYAALSVYRAALALKDEARHRRPAGGLAARSLYAERLPPPVAGMHKARAALPLPLYMKRFPARKLELQALLDCDAFIASGVKQVVRPEGERADPMPLYALMTLSEWLAHGAAVRPARREARPLAPASVDGAKLPLH